MTATASDGRALTGGTWSSDNTPVATVGTTGLVTPTGPGQAHIIFTASSGQQGNKLVRGLPSLSGTFTGNYSLTGCTPSGQAGQVLTCSLIASFTRLSYTFIFTQSGDVVNGRFLLGSIEFNNVSGTIDLGGKLSFNGRGTINGIDIDATWNLSQARPFTLGGTVAQVWSMSGLSGQQNGNGSIVSVQHTAAVSSAGKAGEQAAAFSAIALDSGR